MDVRLRRLADYLLSRKDASEVNPAQIGANLLPHLYILEVERSDGRVFLRVRLTGSALDSAFGRPLVGRHIDEFIHGPRGTEVRKGFHACAETRGAVWMRQVVRIRDKLPRFVEGIAVFVEPNRIYGGLLIGEMPSEIDDNWFEVAPLRGGAVNGGR